MAVWPNEKALKTSARPAILHFITQKPLFAMVLLKLFAVKLPPSDGSREQLYVSDVTKRRIGTSGLTEALKPTQRLNPYFPSFSRLPTSSQFTTFHQAAMYSGRLFWYFR